MKIGFLLDSIDHGTVVLPEFQRGYVWSREQVKGLIQSLYQRFPVGGLLIWNTRADVTELRGSTASGSQNVKLLLDGQQRVTSLYGVVRGEPPEFFEDPQRAKAFTGLYFHLERETFEFYAPSKMSDDPLWISVTDLMLEGPEEVTSRLSQIDGIAPMDLVRYVNRAQRLYGLRDIELHDENISGDAMTVDVVVDIFNRVNSGGTKLSKGDLALARICAIRPAAREELRATIDRWRSAGFDFALDWFLRCVNVVATGEARFEAMRNLAPEDFGVAMKKTEQAIDFLLNVVATRLGLDHDRVLLGRYGFPVLVKVVVEHGGLINDTRMQNRLLYWYIHQGMWGRYSGSTETVLNRDLAAYEENGFEGLINELEVSRGTLRVRPEDFDTQTIGSRFYPVLYMLTRVNDAKDFCSGLPLSQHLLGKGSKLEVHHIFPKRLLYEHGYERRRVNAVANFAFLTGTCNRSLGKRAPLEYFPEVEGHHQGVLNSQWIPEQRDVWELDRYLDFVDLRRRALADATNALLDALQEGHLSVDLSGSAGGDVAEEVNDELEGLGDWCVALGLSRPDLSGEIVDEDTGEPLVYPDATWPEGMQRGLSQKVALLLEPDVETEMRLGELGYRFFTSRRALKHYVEELLDIDLDGDGVIGPVDSDLEPPVDDAQAPSDPPVASQPTIAPSSRFDSFWRVLEDQLPLEKVELCRKLVRHGETNGTVRIGEGSNPSVNASYGTVGRYMLRTLWSIDTSSTEPRLYIQPRRYAKLPEDAPLYGANKWIEIDRSVRVLDLSGRHVEHLVDLLDQTIEWAQQSHRTQRQDQSPRGVPTKRGHEKDPAIDKSDPYSPSDIDVLVVPARIAYPIYLQYHAYVCQPDRTFRSVSRMAFYAKAAIQQHVPLIRGIKSRVHVTRATAAELQNSDSELERDFGVLVQRLIDDGTQEDGEYNEMILLTGPDEPKTLRLDQPIPNTLPHAYTQSQRYTCSSFLRSNPSGTAQLIEWEQQLSR